MHGSPLIERTPNNTKRFANVFLRWVWMKSVLYVQLVRDENEGTHNLEPTQKCMVVFRPGSILTSQSVRWMSTTKVPRTSNRHLAHIGLICSTCTTLWPCAKDIKQEITESTDKLSCVLHWKRRDSSVTGHIRKASGRNGEKMYSVKNRCYFRRHGCPCEDLCRWPHCR